MKWNKGLGISILGSISIHSLILGLLHSGADPGPQHLGTVAIDYVSVVEHRASLRARKIRPRSETSFSPPKTLNDLELSGPKEEGPLTSQLTSDGADSSQPEGEAENSGGTPVVTTATGEFIGQIVKLLEKNKIYPPDSIDREEEGKVLLAITLDRAGHLLRLEIESSSNFRRLDEAAIASIRQIKRLPEVPEILEAPIHLHIPLVFRIENKKN